MCETRGMFFLAAGYVRSQTTLGYTPSAEELDFVAMTLERFGERLAQDRNDLHDAGLRAITSLALPKPPKAMRQPRRP